MSSPRNGARHFGLTDGLGRGRGRRTRTFKQTRATHRGYAAAAVGVHFSAGGFRREGDPCRCVPSVRDDRHTLRAESAHRGESEAAGAPARLARIERGGRRYDKLTAAVRPAGGAGHDGSRSAAMRSRRLAGDACLTPAPTTLGRVCLDRPPARGARCDSACAARQSEPGSHRERRAWPARLGAAPPGVARRSLARGSEPLAIGRRDRRREGRDSRPAARRSSDRRARPGSPNPFAGL